MNPTELAVPAVRSRSRLRALVLAGIAACSGSGDQPAVDAAVAGDAAARNSLAATVDGKPLEVRALGWGYSDQDHAVSLHADLRCTGCSAASFLDIAIQVGMPTDCSSGWGVKYVDVNIHQSGKYYDREGACLRNDAIGASSGSRIKGGFDGMLHLDRTGGPEQIAARFEFDVVLE